MKSFRISNYAEEEENEKIRAVAKEKRLEDKIVAKEKLRASMEKYSFRAVKNRWLAIPVVASLLALGIGGYSWYVTDTTNWYFWVAGVAMFIFGLGYDVGESWEKRYELKTKIKLSDNNYKWANNPHSFENENIYKEGYIYTDSLWENFMYKLLKILSYLVTITAVVAIAIALFSWFGSISIAPTTIIIILLIIIIVNQK